MLNATKRNIGIYGLRVKQRKESWTRVQKRQEIKHRAYRKGLPIGHPDHPCMDTIMDVLLNLGRKDIIIVECKSVKDKDYNKFTAVSRQLKSYQNSCKKKGYHVSQVVIVSNEFTEDFISECEYG